MRIYLCAFVLFISFVLGCFKQSNDKNSLRSADFYYEFVKALIKNNQSEMQPIYTVFQRIYADYNNENKTFDCIEAVFSELKGIGIDEKEIILLKEYTNAGAAELSDCSERLVISAESEQKNRLSLYQKQGRSAILLYPCIAALIILVIV